MLFRKCFECLNNFLLKEDKCYNLVCGHSIGNLFYVCLYVLTIISVDRSNPPSHQLTIYLPAIYLPKLNFVGFLLPYGIAIPESRSIGVRSWFRPLKLLLYIGSYTIVNPMGISGPLPFSLQNISIIDSTTKWLPKPYSPVYQRLDKDWCKIRPEAAVWWGIVECTVPNSRLSPSEES